jgi:hypothetical protein
LKDSISYAKKKDQMKSPSAQSGMLAIWFQGGSMFRLDPLKMKKLDGLVGSLATFVVRQIHDGLVTLGLWQMKRHLGEEGRVLELEDNKESRQEARPNELGWNLANLDLRPKCLEDST